MSIFNKFRDEDKYLLLDKLNTSLNVKDFVNYLMKEYGIKKRTAYEWRVKLLKFNNVKNYKDTDNMYVKGKSTLYDKDGKVMLQWLKEDLDEKHRTECIKESILRFIDNVTPRSVIKDPCVDNSDLMTVYTIGDAHIGMFSWKEETGIDYGLKETEERLLKAMDYLVENSPDSKEALIVDVGDYFHTDNGSNKTNKNGNSLDVEGRYAKILDLGLRLSTELVDMALKKHSIVRWRSAVGNHNEYSALMISVFMKGYYRNNDRVIIEDTPNMFMYYQFGQNLIGITHGHTVKAKDLGEIMSVDCEDIWSESKYRWWITGHVHHDTRVEYRSCVVETFRTLAPRDSWHNSSGYRSMQDMKAVVLHKDYGEISRNTVNVKRILDIK